MARVVVTNVEVLDNPCNFTNPFQFEIIFDCIAPGITSELEWKLLYVGSAEDEKYDQELDSILVGPVEVGTNKFVFQAPAPDPSHIPAKDLLEVTVILLTCSYLEQEFIRIGYYVNNDYGDNKLLIDNPPETPSLPDIWRHILADQPRVTRIQINWNEKPNPEFLLSQKANSEEFRNNSVSAIVEQKQEDGDEMMDDDDENDNEESDDSQSAVDLLDGEEEYRKSRHAEDNIPVQAADSAMTDN